MKQLVHIDADLDPQALSQIDRMAAERGVPAATLVGEALERYLEYETWFIAKVEEGIRAADAGDLIDHEDVETVMKRRFG
jgi:predicted transcriptional regulator